MKRLMLLGVSVALCSFMVVQWIKKEEKEIEISLTPFQQKWLKEQFALEDAINEAQRKVNLLQEKQERIINERKRIPHWSATDARILIQEIEASKKYAMAKNCIEPTEHLKAFCLAYQEAKADREWWARLSSVAVELSVATQDLIEAKIRANQFGDATPEIKQKLLKHTGNV